MDLQGDPFLTVARPALPSSVHVPQATDISLITIVVFLAKDLRVGMKTSPSVPIPTTDPVILAQECQMMPPSSRGDITLRQRR